MKPEIVIWGQFRAMYLIGGVQIQKLWSVIWNSDAFAHSWRLLDALVPCGLAPPNIPNVPYTNYNLWKFLATETPIFQISVNTVHYSHLCHNARPRMTKCNSFLLYYCLFFFDFRSKTHQSFNIWVNFLCDTLLGINVPSLPKCDNKS